MGIVTDVFLPLALAFIMFSLGLGLVADDFRRVVTRPRDFFVGAICQIVLLPAVAFGLVSVFPLAPELALGVMIIAVAPGGVTSNVLTSFAKGDVALSISLTAVISLLSVLTIPVVVAFSYAQIMGGAAAEGASIVGTAVSVFLIVTVPVLAGMAARAMWANFAQRFEPLSRKISMILFVLVLLGAVVAQRDNIIPYFAQAGAVTLALNVAMMVLAYSVAAGLGTGPAQRIAISIECGLQNGTLAIAVATLMFGGGMTVIPAATYSLTMFATALVFVYVLRRRSASWKNAPA